MMASQKALVQDITLHLLFQQLLFVIEKFFI